MKIIELVIKLSISKGLLVVYLQYHKSKSLITYLHRFQHIYNSVQQVRLEFFYDVFKIFCELCMVEFT